MILKINEKDNVCTSLEKITAGQEISVDDIHMTALTDVPFGHKIALVDIKKDEKIIKYGAPIGKATVDIKKGSHVHSHNMTGIRASK